MHILWNVYKLTALSCIALGYFCGMLLLKHSILSNAFELLYYLDLNHSLHRLVFRPNKVQEWAIFNIFFPWH